MNFATQEFRAEARFQRVSPRKARLVLDLIKGRRVEEAINTLTFTKKAVAPAVEKLLRSALENANYASSEKGFDIDVDNLYVKRAIANDGPRMKRIRPAPMGRAYRYQRRMAHMEIALAERRRTSEESLAAASEAPAGTAPPSKSSRGKTAGRAKKKKITARKLATKKKTAKK